MRAFTGWQPPYNSTIVSSNSQNEQYLERRASSTSSGLYYVIEVEGTGTQPTAASTVNVDYRGYLTDGTVFDQTATGTTFNLGDVIKGWQEGIPLFKEGGKGKLLIPSALAYGTAAKQNIPEIATEDRTTSLNSPKAFCKRRPHFKKQPCITTQNVNTSTATSRALNPEGVNCSAWMESTHIVRRTAWERAVRGQHTFSNEIKRIYLAHRLGDVRTGEASILVCVSSAHRKAAFELCEEVLEEVKRQVPIWKKEIYDGTHAGLAEWKANSQSHWKKEGQSM